MVSISVMLLFQCIFATTTRIYVLFGPSQAGKSSFVNSLAGRSLAEIGSGMGISQTTKCQEYLIKRADGDLIILDVPGLSDNFNNSTDENVMETIREKVMGYLTAIILEQKTDKKTIDGIIIFEPLDWEYSQVRQTIVKAEQLFGPTLYESSLVVFTKGDLDYARQPDELGHLPTCEWSNVGVDKYRLEIFWTLMKSKLSSLQPYYVQELDAALAEVQRLAKLACENQPPRFTKVTITENKNVQDGFRDKKVKRDLPPVTRYRDDPHEYPDQRLVSKGRPFADIRSAFVERFLEPIRGNIDIFPGLTFFQNVLPRVNQAASACAEIYMQDISKKTDCELQEELRTKWPWGTQHTMGFGISLSIWQQVLVDARRIGCGADIYETVTIKSTVKVPYPHIETIEEIVQEPVFKTVEETVTMDVPAPNLKEEEFYDDAKEQKAKIIRKELDKKI